MTAPAGRGLPLASRSRLDYFCALYAKDLQARVQTSPSNYMWPAGNASVVAQLMRFSIEKGIYSKDSPSVRAVCRALGIKCTYKAIAVWLANTAPVSESEASSHD